MSSRSILRGVLLGFATAAILPCLLAQQTGQTGNGNGSNNTNGNNSAGNNTNSSGRNTGSGTFNRSNGQDPQLRRQQPLFITGSVEQEDGSPPPMGVVIERVCGGAVTREAYASPNGSFGFQVGANNNVLADASDPDPAGTWDPRGTSRGSYFTGTGFGSSTRLVGCEIRAQLGGYRSSVVWLDEKQLEGTLDIGTIVIYPAVRIQGTTVSATSLSAPKDARKAFERAEKALRKNDFEEAEKDLDHAVGTFPKYAAAWYMLGLVREQSHHNDEARDAFSRALEADGNYVSPYIGLARLAAMVPNWQETADLTKHALELNALDLPYGYYLNSLANFNLHNMDDAERSAFKLKRLDAVHRFPEIYLVLAGICRSRHDNAGEAEQLRTYLKYAPQAENANQVRARIHILDGSAPSP